jgi:hypothetical protein
VKIEKKLVAYSAIALMIGVVSIMPLLLLMSGAARAETGPKPYFGMDINYAFVRITNASSIRVGDQTTNMSGNGPYLEEIIFYNNTIYADANSELPDAVIEYFLIQIYSDKGPIENITEFAGASFNSSFTMSMADSFMFNRENWFDSNTSGGGGFYMDGLQWLPSVTGGHGSSTNVFINYGEPETIYINVSRLGSVIFSGNSTLVSLSTAEFLGQIQLEKYKDGFLFNKLLSEDELSQIDPLDPGSWNASTS